VSRIKNNLPLVIITGRTNVGKSTLFNRLTEKKQAIVSKIPGTTRDLNRGICRWQGYEFMLMDTAGLDVEETLEADKKAVVQARRALKKAAVILLLVDGQTGLLAQDKKFAQVIKKLKKPTLLVVNKIDAPRQRHLINDFFSLNFKEIQPISAANGAQTGDLLDKIIFLLKKSKTLAEQKNQKIKNPLKIAIIGKPNVGKSSLFNAIAGEEQAIVSKVPHTTRDTQDILIQYSHPKLKTPDHKIDFVFIDTAGIRRKAKIKHAIEKLSVNKALETIKRADIVLFILDISQPVTHQDQALVSKIVKTKKSVIIVANKWDLIIEKTSQISKNFENYIYQKFSFLKWAPIVFVSAKSGFNVPRLLNLIYDIWKERTKILSDKELERFAKSLVKKQRPVQARGPERPYIKEIIQSRTNPPTFIIYLTKGQGLHFSYLRFIENQLRKKFKFLGTPIVWQIEKIKDQF